MGAGESRGRYARWGLAAVLLLLGGFLLWVVVAVGLGGYHLAGARATAEDLEQALRDRDAPAATQELDELAAHTAGVGRWLGGAPTSLLTWLPWVGDTIAATNIMASAVDDVVTEMAPAAATVIVSGSGDVTALAAALQEASQDFASASSAADAALPLVEGIDPDDMIGPLQEPVRSAQEQFAAAASGVQGLAAGSVLLPGMLGANGPTQWVAVVGQPAEARGSGSGFFGAVGVMEATDEGLRLQTARPNDEFFDRPADLSALPGEFHDLWGDQAAYIWGHNLTRHFPYAAELLAQTAASTGADPAYVVAVDPRVIAALLEVTGPVTAAGATIDADTAEAYLTSGIYQQYPDAEDKDRVAIELMSAVLVALQESGADPVALAAALAEPVSQQRLVAWAADPAEQDVLAGSIISGVLPPDDLTLTASLNNSGGNKLDAYLDSRVEATLEGQCGAETTGRVATTLEFTGMPSNLPRYVLGGASEYGVSRMMVHVYGPPGAQMTAFTVNGTPALLEQGTELGRPVWGTQVDLRPDTPVTVEVAFTGSWPDSKLDFVPQPMIRDTAVTLNDQRACPR